MTAKEQESILVTGDEEVRNLQCEFLDSKEIIGGNPKFIF